MINEFSLQPLEKKEIINDFIKLTTLQTHQIAYYEESTGFGYDVNDGKWSSYNAYKCVLESISKLNIKRYPYGNISEGDLVLLFPTNHTLPDSNKYKVEFNDNIYTCNNGLIPQDFLDETTLYYAGVFTL